MPTFLSAKKIVYKDNDPCKGSYWGSNAYGCRRPNGTMYFVSCRDKTLTSEFGTYEKEFYFSHRLNNGMAIASFIDKLESRLEIDTRSVFAETDDDLILFIKLSPFWTETKLKFSFFTAIIRVACRYKPDVDNFDEIIYNHFFMTSNKLATERFLDGFTESDLVCDGSSGWVRKFEGVDPSFVKQHLKPSFELKRRRAYQIYLKRLKSGIPGNHKSDWMQAEAELLKE